MGYFIWFSSAQHCNFHHSTNAPLQLLLQFLLPTTAICRLEQMHTTNICSCKCLLLCYTEISFFFSCVALVLDIKTTEMGMSLVLFGLFPDWEPVTFDYCVASSLDLCFCDALSQECTCLSVADSAYAALMVHKVTHMNGLPCTFSIFFTFTQVEKM